MITKNQFSKKNVPKKLYPFNKPRKFFKNFGHLTRDLDKELYGNPVVFKKLTVHKK